jgi:putative zinc finger protein
MSHLDEGMLHELLDGELSADAARSARAHLTTCADCRALYEEAREFFEESNRLVTALDGPRALESRPPALPPSRLRRGLQLHTLAWAASIFLAISLGYYGSDFRRKTSGEAAKLADSAMSPSGNLESLPGGADGKSALPAATETTPTALKERRQAQPAIPPAPVGRAVPMRTDQAVGARAEPPQPPEADRLRGQADNLAASRGLAETDQVAQEAVAQSAPPAAPLNAAARAAAPAAAPLFHKVPMEEAVRTLGGTIRLIGGLTPERVETVSGQLVTGARPDHLVVRVIYLDPPRREIWLDQQHEVGSSPAGADTILVPSPNGAQSLQWRPASGEWLSLTGFLTADSLKALARRVK